MVRHLRKKPSPGTRSRHPGRKPETRSTSRDARRCRPKSPSRGTVGDPTGASKIRDPVGGRHRLLGHRQQETQDAMGHTNDSIMVMNATRVPIVIQPVPGRVGAEGQHDDQGDVGNDLQQRPEPRRHRHLWDLGVVQVGGLPSNRSKTTSLRRTSPPECPERPPDVVVTTRPVLR